MHLNVVKPYLIPLQEGLDTFSHHSPDVKHWSVSYMLRITTDFVKKQVPDDVCCILPTLRPFPSRLAYLHQPDLLCSRQWTGTKSVILVELTVYKMCFTTSTKPIPEERRSVIIIICWNGWWYHEKQIGMVPWTLTVEVCVCGFVTKLIIMTTFTAWMSCWVQANGIY